MLILILMNVQYLLNVVFTFKKRSNGQNHSSSDYYHPIKISPSKISHPPLGRKGISALSLKAIWKTLLKSTGVHKKCNFKLQCYRGKQFVEILTQSRFQKVSKLVKLG